MPGTTFTPLLFLPLCVLPVATGYAMLRYHFLNTNYLVSKLVLYGLLTVIVAGAYALIVSGIGLLLGDFLRPYRPFIAGIIIFLLALLLNPLRTRLQKLVDSVFFRGQAVYRSRLEAFSKDLTQAIDLGVIVRLLRQYSSQDLHPDRAHIYIYESFNGQYSAQLDENEQITSDLRFTDKSDLVNELAHRRDAIILQDVNSLPASLQSERSRLVLLDCQIFIPLPGRQHLIGWLALGERESGEQYTERDIAFPHFPL